MNSEIKKLVDDVLRIALETVKTKKQMKQYSELREYYYYKLKEGGE